MLETFRTYCSIDAYGRLNVLSSTQIVFHTRRIIANALHIPKSMIRVSKPRIGGGWQREARRSQPAIYPAFVTWMTKKPSKIIFSRVESQTASSPRHEMQMHVRLGATKDSIDARHRPPTRCQYGRLQRRHSPTTVGLSSHQVPFPLYGKAEAFRFTSDVVYTNIMSAGAYRGYGATQGLFAVESAVNELAARLGMDPFELREKNIVREGDVMPAYYGQVNTSCTLDRCLARVREMIDWDNKYPCRDMGDGKVRAVGMGMAMQGSGITSMDVGSASLKLNDFGFYTLRIAAADMGTGCDTTLAQIAAEVLECPLDKVITLGADTDSSPYDSGSYASSTIYVTGKATEKCALELRDKIKAFGAEMMGVKAEEVSFDGTCVRVETGEQEGRSVTLEEIGASTQNNNNTALEATVSPTSEISPPPYMVGAAGSSSTWAGEISVIDYAACVDCGTPISQSARACRLRRRVCSRASAWRVTENVTLKRECSLLENSFLEYKIQARRCGTHRVDFDAAMDAGPFSAKVDPASRHQRHPGDYGCCVQRDQKALLRAADHAKWS